MKNTKILYALEQTNPIVPIFLNLGFEISFMNTCRAFNVGQKNKGHQARTSCSTDNY